MWDEIISITITLFLLLDPFGNIPLFVNLLEKYDLKKQRKIIIREHFIALLVLLIFLFFGKYILRFLSISQLSITFAGGIILFLISIKMIFPYDKHTGIDNDKEEPFIFPLAIPYIAGPSTIAALIVIVNNNPQKTFYWLISLIIAWAISGIILFFSSYINLFVGKKGTNAIEKIMGLILISISIEMIVKGIKNIIISIYKSL